MRFRSSWKFPYIYQYSNYMNIKFEKKNIKSKIFKRNITLSTTFFLNKRSSKVTYPKHLSDLDVINVYIYSGKTLANVRLLDKMIGFKLGEFVPTKITGDKVSYRKRMLDLSKKKKHSMKLKKSNIKNK